MKISVVIPTRNRLHHLKKLLKSIQSQTLQPSEIIIVEASDAEFISPNEFETLPITIIQSHPSVCLQRNLGIKQAKHEWIFLCDDDIELPADYLSTIADHVNSFPGVVAVSGLVMQRQNNEWIGQYPVVSKVDLLFRYIFHLSIWGEINIQTRDPLVSSIKNYFKRRGNHLSKSGWPVLTEFSGEYFSTPVYGLGASVIKKEWLLQSPYDESLDPHGLGDHYGVALGFPEESIHVVNAVKAYHNSAAENRLKVSEQYYRRVLALINFSKLRQNERINRGWLLWSILGSTMYFILSGKFSHAKAGIKLIANIF